VPILKKQSGFVDEIILNADAEPDRVLALGFWKTREDAERYRHEQYKYIHDSLRHLLKTEPNIRTFDVHTGAYTTCSAMLFPLDKWRSSHDRRRFNRKRAPSAWQTGPTEA
jgi:heme-degrading monooxygenase HmoA